MTLRVLVSRSLGSSDGTCITRVECSAKGRQCLVVLGTALRAKAFAKAAESISQLLLSLEKNSDATLAWGVPDFEPRCAEADQAGGDHTCHGWSVRFQFVLPSDFGRPAVSRSKLGTPVGAC